MQTNGRPPIDKSYLLDDKSIQDFIADGYLAIEPDLPPAFHREIYRKVCELIEEEGNPGNDLLPRLPMLQDIFADPQVSGALSSILGPDYALHRHRHCHYWPPDSAAQTLHKDYPIEGNVHAHRGRWALAFYYPQDVDADMGPTAVQPGTQYYMHPRDDTPELPLCYKAGTVVIAHYEIWHRATANCSDRTRLMLKFLFGRTREPRSSDWNAENPAWQSTTPAPYHTLWRHMWRWYRNAEDSPWTPEPSVDIAAALRDLQAPDVQLRRCAADQLGLAAAADKKIIAALRIALRDTDEPVRLNTAYALGTLGNAAVPTLMAALREEAASAWQPNLERGDFANPSQLDTAFGLAALGTCAVPALTDALADENWWTRAGAATALGCMGRPARGAVDALTSALDDDSEWVRRNAAEALGNIGHPAPDAISALTHALNDTCDQTPWSLSKFPFQENAATALAKMDPLPQTTVPLLIESLKSDSEYLRAWAAIALRHNSSDDARHALARLEETMH